MTDKAYAATPAETLEQHIMDSRIAKSEAEWWASRTIEALRAENAKLREALKPFADEASVGPMPGDPNDPRKCSMKFLLNARKALEE